MNALKNSPIPETLLPPSNQRPVAGALWMMASGLCFVFVIALVKSQGDAVPAAQSAFLRFALGAVELDL